MTIFSKSIATAILAAGFAVSAQAAIVIPISATASSSYLGFDASNAIDTGVGSSTTDWASNTQGVGSTLFLNLGAVYSLASVSVTDRVTSGAGNGSYVGGLTDFTTSFSLTVYTDSSFTTAIGSPLVFNKSVPVSPTGVSDFLSTFTFASLSGQYIGYTVLAPGTANNPGLANISFTTTAVPEPTTWALIVVGFGLVGFAARRRKGVVAA